MLPGPLQRSPRPSPHRQVRQEVRQVLNAVYESAEGWGLFGIEHFWRGSCFEGLLNQLQWAGPAGENCTKQYTSKNVS